MACTGPCEYVEYKFEWEYKEFNEPIGLGWACKSDFNVNKEADNHVENWLKENYPNGGNCPPGCECARARNSKPLGETEWSPWYEQFNTFTARSKIFPGINCLINYVIKYRYRTIHYPGFCRKGKAEGSKKVAYAESKEGLILASIKNLSPKQRKTILKNLLSKKRKLKKLSPELRKKVFSLLKSKR